jgi:hypothetical protein
MWSKLEQSQQNKTFPAREHRTWFPTKKEHCGDAPVRLRCFRERLMVLLDDADGQESRLGKPLSLIIIVAIVISCINLCLESIPSLLFYETECSQCKPLPYKDQQDTSKVAARAALHTECVDCTPGEHPVFSALEMICIILFTAEYLLRFVCASAISLGNDEVGNPLERRPTKWCGHQLTYCGNSVWAKRTW